MPKTATKKTVKKSSPVKKVSPKKRSSAVKSSKKRDSSTDMEIVDETLGEEIVESFVDDDNSDEPETPPTRKPPVKKKASKKSPSDTTSDTPSVEKEYEDTTAGETYCDPESPYPNVNILPYFHKRFNPKALGPLTAKKAKELLGWKELPEKIKGQFLFKDRRGNKITCEFNTHNRPFYATLAEKWMLEILRGKWKLNGETCIIDCEGMTQDAQHRLVGLIWAVQEWEDHGSKWRKYWKHPPVIDVIVVTGIPNDDETINTMNTGKPRTLTDAIFRSAYFQNIRASERVRVGRMAEWCIKFLWKRTGQKELSNAPSMPHSEAFEFVNTHEKVIDAVRHVYEEDSGSKNLINGFVHNGQAAGMLYLMGTSKSDRDVYLKHRSEEGIDLGKWDKAEEFWTLLAQKSSKIEPVTEAILHFPEKVAKVSPTALPNGADYNRFKAATVAKAWDLFSRGKVIKSSLIEIGIGIDGNGNPYVMECPLFGGIDIGEGLFLEEPKDTEQEEFDGEEDTESED